MGQTAICLFWEPVFVCIRSLWILYGENVDCRSGGALQSDASLGGGQHQLAGGCVRCVYIRAPGSSNRNSLDFIL